MLATGLGGFAMPADALWVLSVVAGGDDDPYLSPES
jgi:hypothetical protein